MRYLICSVSQVADTPNSLQIDKRAAAELEVKQICEHCLASFFLLQTLKAKTKTYSNINGNARIMILKVIEILYCVEVEQVEELSDCGVTVRTGSGLASARVSCY